MATSIDMVLNLRSAREWNSGFEDADLPANWKNFTPVEECERRLERILAAARGAGLQAQNKPHREIASPLLEDLAMQEAQIGRAVRFLHRRQMEGAFLEAEWRAFTSSTKIIEESLEESR